MIQRYKYQQDMLLEIWTHADNNDRADSQESMTYLEADRMNQQNIHRTRICLHLVRNIQHHIVLDELHQLNQ